MGKSCDFQLKPYKLTTEQTRRFCATPSWGAIHKSSALTSVCGECHLNALASNLFEFARSAVTEHNAARFQESATYLREHDEDDVPVADLLADFVPDPDFLGEKMDRLQSVMCDLNVDPLLLLTTLSEQDEIDGTFDLDEVLDLLREIDWRELCIADVKDAFKGFGIPTTVRSKISFTRGTGLRLHTESTHHDVDMGK